VCPSLPPYDLHTQFLCVDQSRDVSDHHSSYHHDVCSYWQSFDHDVNSCPYYDVSDEAYARLNATIEKMYEQHTHFVSEIRECGLLHVTNLSLPFPILEASLYDDSETSLPLDSNVVDNAPLSGLEKVFDPPLTSFSLVAPSFSGTPTASSVSALTLLASIIPLV